MGGAERALFAPRRLAALCGLYAVLLAACTQFVLLCESAGSARDAGAVAGSVSAGSLVAAARRALLPAQPYDARPAEVPRAETAPLSVALDDVFSRHFERDGAAARLSRILQFRTVSALEAENHLVDGGNATRALLRYLQQRSGADAPFPRAARTLEWETLGDGCTFLATWRGSDASLAPLLLISHSDVVPAEEGDTDQWKQPPFAGAIDPDDGYLYGRGALDTKSSFAAPLEAIELLLAEHERRSEHSWRPRRTIMLAVGHDEEVGGRLGAARVAKLLQERGVQPLFSVDEGGACTEGMISGVEAGHRVALVGVAEKGSAFVNITVSASGGHSSAPEAQGTAIESLSAALLDLRRARLPEALAEPTTHVFDYLWPYMKWPQRLLVRHWRLFRWPLRQLLRRNREFRAQLGSKYASTIVRGGHKENVIPSTASAVLNWRTSRSLPDPLPFVRRALRRTEAARDPARQLHIETLGHRVNMPPSPIAPVDDAFRDIQRSIAAAFGSSTLSTPYYVFANTDTRHYTLARVGTRHYRFSPLMLHGAADFGRVHGVNERIHPSEFATMVRFFAALMLRTGESMPAEAP